MIKEATVRSFMLHHQRILAEKRFFRLSLGIAVLLELIILGGISAYQSGFLHSPLSGGNQSLHDLEDRNFIEAQVFHIQESTQSHLKEVKKARVPPKKEAVLSRVPKQGKAVSGQPPIEEENQTQEAPPERTSRGPVAVHAPSPRIPSYLQHQNLKTSVVIMFYVSAKGTMSPKLIRSSGNPELDAVALKTVNQWQFKPAIKDQVPVDSKVALKIIFKVE